MRARLLSALVTASLIAGAVGAYALTRGDHDTYEVTADVAQAPNLFEEGRVMVRGVEVGTISDVDPQPEGVRLTLKIHTDVAIPADARLSVIPITIISDRYVQLFPAYSGQGETLADGDHIPMERTSIPAELDEVLEQLKGLLAAFEPRGDEASGPLARLIHSLDDALRGRSDELGEALEGSAAVLSNLAASESDITGLIRNLDRVFVALANRASQIGLVNERFQLVAESLLADQRNLEGTVENLAFLSEQAAGLVGESGDDLGESFGRLARVLRAVLRHQDDIRVGVRWANAIAQALGATDASGRGLFAYSGLQAPPGSPGAEYNYRLDRRDTLTCERINETAETLFVVTPSATEEDVVGTLKSYIPDPYDDDLDFLLRLLVDACVDRFAQNAIDKQAAATVRRAAADVGAERFGRLVARWLFGDMQETAP